MNLHITPHVATALLILLASATLLLAQSEYYCERAAAWLLARADALRYFKARRAHYERDLTAETGDPNS